MRSPLQWLLAGVRHSRAGFSTHAVHQTHVDAWSLQALHAGRHRLVQHHAHCADRIPELLARSRHRGTAVRNHSNQL